MCHVTKHRYVCVSVQGIFSCVLDNAVRFRLPHLCALAAMHANFSEVIEQQHILSASIVNLGSQCKEPAFTMYASLQP